MSDAPTDPRRGELIAVLGDARRRAVYEAVVSAARPMTRDEVADRLQITRSAAAFHLDRLAEAGVMAVSFSRPPGRGGPGAGRPAKRYAALSIDLEVTVPPRRYRELADVLAETAADLGDENDLFMSRAREAAFARGVRHAGDTAIAPAPLASAAAALDRLGYLTDCPSPDRVVLRNCPYRAIAESSPEVVCTLNERYVAGVVSGLGLSEELRVVGDGRAPDCCVTVSRRGEVHGLGVVADGLGGSSRERRA